MKALIRKVLVRLRLLLGISDTEGLELALGFVLVFGGIAYLGPTHLYEIAPTSYRVLSRIIPEDALGFGMVALGLLAILATIFELRRIRIVTSSTSMLFTFALGSLLWLSVPDSFVGSVLVVLSVAQAWVFIRLARDQ